MVDATELKFYRSASGGASLGGDITSTEITSGTTNNLFNNVPRSEQVTGTTDYLCMYIKNTSSEEIKNVAVWLSAGTPGAETSIFWGLEEVPDLYAYAPSEDFNGSSDFIDVTDDPTLDLSAFTIACWFKTSTDYSGAEGAIVNKGGFGSDSAGENMNYGLWITTSNELRGGFEDGSGTDKFVTDPGLAANNGKWTHAAVTYDGSSVLRLYKNGDRVASLGTGATPETNSKPLTIGKNSRANDRYFDGEIDEIRVWNKALTWDDIVDLRHNGEVLEIDSIVYANKFGTNNGSRIAQEIATIKTEPVGITWQSAGSQPSSANIGRLGPGGYRPIWIKWVVAPGASEKTNDRCIFSFRYDITTAGTGTGGQTGGGGGGGSGGNPPSIADNYKIAVVGDWGEESATDDVVDMISGDYDLVIGTGDNSYTSSDDQWYDIIADIDDNQGSQTRFETANGNHDSESSIKTHFKVPNTHYSFDFQNVHVLILDTEKDMDEGSSQHTFAQNDLEAQASRGNIDWIFVAFHRPMTGPDSDHANNEENQIETYMDMFLENGVNLVLCGHNHIWYRSYPIKHGSGSSVSKVINGDGPYTVGDPNPWLISVISGTGGHDSGSSLYDLDSTPSHSAYQNNTNNGILSIEASNNGQTLTCKFINTDNSTKHTWVMNK